MVLTWVSERKSRGWVMGEEEEGGAKGRRGSLSAGHWARSTGGAKEGLGTREGVHLQAAGTRGVRQAGMLAGMQHCREETEKEEKRGARPKVQGAAEGTGSSIVASSPLLPSLKSKVPAGTTY